MELTSEIKGRVLEAIKTDRTNYPSDNKHAVALGIRQVYIITLKKGLPTNRSAMRTGYASHVVWA